MTRFGKTMARLLREAVRNFWTVREKQLASQGGEEAEAKDRGGRGAVTGGKQMDGFLLLVHDLLVEAGLTSATIYCRGHPLKADKPRRRRKGECYPDAPSCTQTELPGWFRAEKDWDLLVVTANRLVAAIEFHRSVPPSGTISTTEPRRPSGTPRTSGPPTAKAPSARRNVPGWAT
jgi:hypothetical protein